MQHTVRPLVAALTVAATLATAPAAADDHGGSKMPVADRGEPKSNQFWFPELVDLSPLRDHDTSSNPYGEDFDYAAAFATVDYDELKADMREVLTDSQPWWPADYGHYGPFFIRMAWHSAGTYRTADGRGGAGGGQQRFEPLNSWPDNANLDKARRLLWPLKQKYGRNVSWADLMVLAGTVAMEDMGFETFGFAGGREDDWEPDLVYWGPETTLGASDRGRAGDIPQPLGATVMGLIYVNPEGPGRSHDPLAAAAQIRESFGRMAMNDAETVALIAGGHTFGKVHGAASPDECVGEAPAATGVEKQGMGWENECGKGNAEDTITSGLEGAWTAAPTQWTMMYLENLFGFEWEQTTSPAGAVQWVPVDDQAAGTVPDAHLENVRHQPIMLTTDLSLKEDPAYRKVSQRFLDNPEEFEDAFARAWFKLTHRDMGPRARYVAGNVPDEKLLWQDPLPEIDYELVTDAQVEDLKERILASGLTVPELVRTAWSSAANYRGTDMRGGTDGGRVRLAPQNAWPANNPEELAKVLSVLEEIQADFNEGGFFQRSRISMADMIVLGGAAAVEKAAADAGHDITVPFTPGRADATAEMTDVAGFAPLEPKADGFRNYYSPDAYYAPVRAMVDRADLLTLTVPEMTVLVGGLRALDANVGGVDHGVFTDRPGQLTPDYFVNLLGMDTKWEPADEDGLYVGLDRATGERKWTATPIDLLFGSHSELRAVSEVYAANDGEQKFVEDFVDAWNKVMMLGRFDV